MHKGKAALLVTVLVVGGHAIVTHWDEIREALGLDEVSPEHIRAIALVKSDYNLDHSRTNYEMIEQQLKGAEQPVEEIGWKATRTLGDVFLVTYRFREKGVERDYYFEVNIGTTKVKNVRGDAELEKRYGVPTRPGR